MYHIYTPRQIAVRKGKLQGITIGLCQESSTPRIRNKIATVRHIAHQFLIPVVYSVQYMLVHQLTGAYYIGHSAHNSVIFCIAHSTLWRLCCRFTSYIAGLVHVHVIRECTVRTIMRRKLLIYTHVHRSSGTAYSYVFRHTTVRQRLSLCIEVHGHGHGHR